MKFSTALISLTSFVSVALAIPSPKLSVGAAFWATNEPSGNRVMAAEILCDGSLSYANSYLTGGNGMKGVTFPDAAPDGLFSGDSVFVNTQKFLLTVVNSASNSISLFGINPLNLTSLRPIGKPAASGGEFPNSGTLNKAATHAYVLNTGKVNGVQVLSVDPIRGLTPIPGAFYSLGLTETTPPGLNTTVGGPGTASDVFFNEDGTKLIVSVKAIVPNIGFLAIWDILPNGQLSKTFKKLSAGPKGSLVFAATLIPGKNALITGDGTIGADIWDLDTGKVTSVNIPGNIINCWVVRSPATGNYYVSDPLTAKVTELHISDQLQATVVNQYTLANGSLPIDMTLASIGNKDYIYVVSGGIRSIQTLALQGPGKATIQAPLDLAVTAPTIPTGLLLQGISHIMKPFV